MANAVLEAIGEVLYAIGYWTGLVIFRLIGIEKPSEKACSTVALVLFLFVIVLVVFYLSRPGT
jgi:hypothetical protein